MKKRETEVMSEPLLRKDLPFVEALRRYAAEVERAVNMPDGWERVAVLRRANDSIEEYLSQYEGLTRDTMLN